MRIFLSHSSRQKPLVREIKAHLPYHLNAWIDEERLLFGDVITSSLEAAIKLETDYVLLFIDEHAAHSDWVRSELQWAFQAEASQNRTILLPIVIDADALIKLDNSAVLARKYLKLSDFQHSSVLKLAEGISHELFALVCRDVNRLGLPRLQSTSDVLADAEKYLATQASMIQKVVFPHRRANPISREKLIEVLSEHDPTLLSPAAFDEAVELITSRGLVPGLHYDGFELFITEEHARWKPGLFHEWKVAVGRRAAGLIRNGMRIFIDAGSTAEEIVRLLCKQIENRSITNLIIATSSVNIDDMFSDCCVKMGFDDDFSAVRLYIPGGRIRPSTQAVVADFDEAHDHIRMLSDKVGGFDLGFIGVNGIDADYGLTTHERSEANNKRCIINVCTKSIVIGDVSKIGLVLDEKFADLSDSNMTLIVNRSPDSEALQALLSRYNERILLA